MYRRTDQYESAGKAHSGACQTQWLRQGNSGQVGRLHLGRKVTYVLRCACRDVCALAHEEVYEAGQQALSTIMRQVLGEGAMAVVMVRKCLEAPSNHVVIDGMRRLSDIELLQKEFGADNVHLGWIETEARTRFDRLTARKSKGGEQFMMWDEFVAQEAAETESSSIPCAPPAPSRSTTTRRLMPRACRPRCSASSNKRSLIAASRMCDCDSRRLHLASFSSPNKAGSGVIHSTSLAKNGIV